MFRPDLEAAMPRAGRSKGDRSPFGHVLIFEVLILRAIRSLSGARRVSNQGSAAVHASFPAKPG
jgi:hypothetical protein